MAYDIGPKIGIDGEADFRRAIQNINTNIKTLGTEMLAVTSAYDANDKSAAALASRNDVLSRQIDAQKEKLDKLREGLAAAAEKYGENDDKTQRWRQTVNVATADLNKMERQLQNNNRELEGFDDSAEDAAGSVDKLDSSVSTAAVTIGNLLSSGIEAAVGALTDMVSAVWNLDEATEEYRTAQGKIQSAFETAGHSTEAAQQAYTDFYKILGDTGTAAEASQMLAQLADSEEDMAQWAGIAAGVAGTFGDALPINGLIEAANETAKVGEVTGALADALNWVGISEDEFNEKLAACGTESERNQAIMETLSTAYAGAADAFYRSNGSILQARESQALLDEALSSLGETAANVKNNLQADFLPAVASLASAFSGVLNGADGADEALAGAIQEMIVKAVEKLPEAVELGTSIITSVLGGITENLPELAGAALEVITTLAGGIAGSLPELIPTVVDVVLQIVETLTDPDSLGSIIGAALEIILSLAEGLIDALPKLVEKAPQIVGNLINAVVENAPKLRDAAFELVAKLASGIADKLSEIAAKGREIVEKVISGIGELFSKLTAKGREIIDTIKSGVKEKVDSAKQWGKDLIQNFIDGITAKWAALKEKVSSVAQTVKNFLGFSEPEEGPLSNFHTYAPDMMKLFSQGIRENAGLIKSAFSDSLDFDTSKVFAGVGSYMAESLGDGFSNEIRAVQRKIDRSMAEIAGNAASVKTEGHVTGVAAGSTGFDSNSLAEVIGAAVCRALDGVAVNMSQRKVGELTTDWQRNHSRAMGV